MFSSWKMPELTKKSANTGDDIAGIVHSVGSSVFEFKPGDRVASFHEMRKPGGSFAEYALAWDWSTFHIAESTSFEEAATIPLAAMTSAVGLYQRLNLPLPWLPATEETPLIVYGGASAVGGFVLKLASLSNIHPLICVAGRGAGFVEGLIDKSKGDAIVDYRKGDEAVVEGLRGALKGKKCFYAYDATSEKGSYQNLCKVLDTESGKSKFTTVLPIKDFEVPKGITPSLTMVSAAHDANKPDSEAAKRGDKVNGRDFAQAFFRLFARGMKEGWFPGHPFEVVPGGLGGVQEGLRNLKEGKASAVKYVFKIEDTPGASKL